MEMDEALKPCPFCGSSDVQVIDNPDINTGEEDWLICCGKCGGAFIASNDAMPVTRSELIARWNDRTWNTPALKDGIRYWPMAKTKDGDNLTVYNSVHTIEKALQQFNVWEEFYGYKIEEAWIRSTDGRRIDVEHRWTAEGEGGASGNPE